MAGHRLKNKEIPWCTCCLVFLCIFCHTAVLIGNLSTASAMQALGSSTQGWSRVGIGLSRSFQVELDVLMGNISSQLLSVIGQMDNAMSGIDSVLSLIGDHAETAVNQSQPQALALVQQHPQAVALLQQGPSIGNTHLSGNITADVTGILVPLVMNTVQTVLDQGMNQLNNLIQLVMDAIRPALQRVGQWIVSFGPQIQSGIEGFSVALDRVQKIFDQIMANLNGHGDNAEDMLHETFGLFDVSHSGAVTIQDLRDMAEIFSLTSLQGTKPEDLVEAYDSDGDGELSQAETELMVEDSSVPNIMATVLRTYARTLSEVAGHVKDATMRKPLSRSVVEYFGLVCAKNQTKVGWISDALGNASLPVDFTASVYAQLCLMENGPNVMTNQDVGQIVISRIYALHCDHAQTCFERMTEPEFWSTNGFDPLDQARCVDRVTAWFAEAQLNETGLTLTYTPPGAFWQAAQTQAAAAVAKERGGNRAPASLFQEAAGRKAVLAAMPGVARRMAEANTRTWLVRKQEAHAAKRASLYRSSVARHLKTKLLGGQTASTLMNPNAEQAVNGGQPAAPQTLRFAAYLAANATATANRFQEMCFNYSSESSNPIDTFATQIQSLVSKTSSFIEMMMTYATPAGIARLEEYAQDFITSAAEQVRQNVQEQVERLINQTVNTVISQLPAAQGAISNGMEAAADAIEAAAQPVEDAVDGVLDAAQGLFDNQTAQVIQGTVDQLENTLAAVVQGLRNGQLPTNLPGIGALPNLPGLTAPLALMQQPGAVEVENAPAESGTNPVIQQIVDVMHSLTNLIPTATNTLTMAQEEVSRAASVMDSLFDMLGTRAPSIFDTISTLYRILWIVYFCIFAPLTLGILYYGMWAGGFLGGPKPLIETGEERYQPPRTCWQRLQVCCSSCCFCCQKCHDTQLCLWSIVIFLQIICLILFVVSIVLCILAGVKAFISAGCAQVYLLTDPTICANTIGGIQNWLSSYFVQEASEVLDEICPTNNLMACQMIASRMARSVLLTTIGSFLAVVFSLQIIIESAVLHEHARYRRMFVERDVERENLGKNGHQESTGV